MEVPYRGDVNATMLDVLGGLRSACTYVGAGKLKVMSTAEKEYKNTIHTLFFEMGLSALSSVSNRWLISRCIFTTPEIPDNSKKHLLFL